MSQTSSTKMMELNEKRSRVESLLARNNLDALLLRRISSFAWYTGGGSDYVNTATETGVGSILIQPGHRDLVLTSRIEAGRLVAEELEGLDFQVIDEPWYEPPHAIQNLTQGLRLGCDTRWPGSVNLAAEIAVDRSRLTVWEQARFRQLGQMCARAMDAAIQAVCPGMPETDVAGQVAGATFRQGAQPIVNLIASDERIFRFRHPIPTAKQVDKYVMIVLCGRWHGLVCSITRLVYFGKLPEDLQAKQRACAHVDATFLTTTRPGTALKDIFTRAAGAYAAAGYPGEWELHHQGGAAGYEAREFLSTPTAEEIVEAGQAYAWNPSVTGTKSEDTILVGESGNDVLTTMAGWPMLAVNLDGQIIHRPAILEVS